MGSNWRGRRFISRFRTWEAAPALLVVVICTVGIAVTLRYTPPLDLELAYKGGQEAWASGHPERVVSWISTPFLGMLMAIVSRLLSVRVATDLLTALNVAIVMVSVGVTWKQLLARVPRPFWWATLVAALLFAPTVSSILWKQFNILVLGLAVAGFLLARQGRSVGAGVLLALSIAIKPIVVLVQLAMLSRSETRKSGIWAITWIAALNAVAQSFLSWRAQSLQNLSPFPALQTFLDRPVIWACHPENYSPYSLLCRVSGGQYYWWQRPVAAAGVVLLILLAVDAIRGYQGGSWELFAFACLLSPMVSPIAWSHYQILLFPMFLLVAYQFAVNGASVIHWLALAAAYGLAELTWRPLGTLVGGVEYVLSGRHETMGTVHHVMSVAQFAQYLLLVVALTWFYRQRRPTATMLGSG